MNQEKEYLLLSVLCFSACHVCVANEKMHVSSQMYTNTVSHHVVKGQHTHTHTQDSDSDTLEVENPAAPLDSMWMTTLPHFVVILLACVHAHTHTNNWHTDILCIFSSSDIKYCHLNYSQMYCSVFNTTSLLPHHSPHFLFCLSSVCHCFTHLWPHVFCQGWRGLFGLAVQSKSTLTQYWHVGSVLKCTGFKMKHWSV